jgi:spoIIIJ-associated protein
MSDRTETLETNEQDYLEISPEAVDEIADMSIEFLEEILKYFEIGDVTIDEYEGDEGELILDITGDNLAILIGRHGNTLSALQTLLSSVILRKVGFRYPVIIDVEGYKNRQREKLESIAQNAATKVIKQKRKVSLHPMSPYERRIIHVALKDNSRVTTASEGEGPNRHVVIFPK